ncbi:hypothetical protein ACJX0J_013235, partial [Zea mays]
MDANKYELHTKDPYKYQNKVHPDKLKMSKTDLYIVCHSDLMVIKKKKLDTFVQKKKEYFLQNYYTMEKIRATHLETYFTEIQCLFALLPLKEFFCNMRFCDCQENLTNHEHFLIFMTNTYRENSTYHHNMNILIDKISTAARQHVSKLKRIH